MGFHNCPRGQVPEKHSLPLSERVFFDFEAHVHHFGLGHKLADPSQIILSFLNLSTIKCAIYFKVAAGRVFFVISRTSKD